MSTSNGSSESNNEEVTDETSEDQQQEQDQQDESTGETPGQDTQQSTKQDADASTAAAIKAAKAPLLADLQKERKAAKASKDRVTELEAQVTELAPVKETLDAVQARYDRLEAFLVEVGGPLSKALDSRSFTRDLFDSDKDISEIVKQWHKDNPSATAAALGSGSARPASKGPNMNELLRAAANK